MTEDRKYPPFSFLIGRVLRDPEDVELGGKPAVKFPIAVNKSYDKGDDYIVGVTVWNSGRGLAYTAAQNLSKGDRVALEGSAREREHNGKTYHDFTPMSVYRAAQVEAEDDL